MRTAFFGYGDLGIAGLDTLLAAGAAVCVVVIPGNRSDADVASLREEAQRRGIPVLVQPPRHQADAFVDTLRRLAPDLIVIWSYSMILPPAVIGLPRLGAVNLHGGLLPQYRGAHVTQWAIINGEREFGVTLHYVDEAIDTGPVVAEQRFALYDDDDALTVKRKMKDAGSTLLRTWWPRLLDRTAPRVPQTDAGARYWPLRTPEDGRITWGLSADTICRHVRALAANWPGAFVDVEARRIAVRRAVALPGAAPDATPGEVLSANADGVRVATGDGDLLILAAEERQGEPIAPAALAELLGHAHV